MRVPPSPGSGTRSETAIEIGIGTGTETGIEIATATEVTAVIGDPPRTAFVRWPLRIGMNLALAACKTVPGTTMTKTTGADVRPGMPPLLRDIRTAAVPPSGAIDTPVPGTVAWTRKECQRLRIVITSG